MRERMKELSAPLIGLSPRPACGESNCVEGGAARSARVKAGAVRPALCAAAALTRPARPASAQPCRRHLVPTTVDGWAAQAAGLRTGLSACFQGCPSRSMALRMTSSLRMQATRMTLGFLPASRLANAAMSGLYRLATRAAMYNTSRTAARPPLIWRSPAYLPLSSSKGATPTRLAMARRDNRPSSGSRAISVCTSTGPTPGTLRRRCSRTCQSSCSATSLASVLSSAASSCRKAICRCSVFLRSDRSRRCSSWLAQSVIHTRIWRRYVRCSTSGSRSRRRRAGAPSSSTAVACAMVRASARSFLASRPFALANKRTRWALNRTTSKPRASRASITAISYPPEASRPTRMTPCWVSQAVSWSYPAAARSTCSSALCGQSAIFSHPLLTSMPAVTTICAIFRSHPCRSGLGDPATVRVVKMERRHLALPRSCAKVGTGSSLQGRRGGPHAGPRLLWHNFEIQGRRISATPEPHGARSACGEINQREAFLPCRIGEALIERNDFERWGTAFRGYEGRRQLQCVGRPQRVNAKKSHRTLGEIMLIATEVATPLRACYRSGRNQFSLEGRQMQFGFSPPVSGALSSPHYVRG